MSRWDLVGRDQKLGMLSISAAIFESAGLPKGEYVYCMQMTRSTCSKRRGWPPESSDMYHIAKLNQTDTKRYRKSIFVAPVRKQCHTRILAQ